MGENADRFVYFQGFLLISVWCYLILAQCALPPPGFGAKIALAIQAKWEGLACGQSVLWNLLKRQRRPSLSFKKLPQ